MRPRSRPRNPARDPGGLVSPLLASRAEYQGRDQPTGHCPMRKPPVSAADARPETLRLSQPGPTFGSGWSGPG
jgi:hypothetical protein